MEIYTIHVYENGTKGWFQNGKLHRADGPAVEFPNGTKYWYQNDQLHRADGPAIEHSSGSKYWYLEGNLHRTNGPAMEWPDGTKYWYLNGKEVTEAEVMGQPSCTGMIVEVEGKKYKLVPQD